MSDVISMPTSRVVIWVALVTETRTRSCDGLEICRHDPPAKIFFVDYHDANGTVGVWDGNRYGDAIAVAREFMEDGSAFLDLTHETWGHA